MSKKQITISTKSIIGIVMISIILIGGVLFLNGNKNNQENKIVYDTKVIIGEDADAINKAVEEAQKKTEEGMLAVEITTNPTFEDGKSEGQVLIKNPTANKKAFKVKFCLISDGSIVYETGAIPPGGRIDNDKLSKNLEKGEYPAVAYFTALDEAGNEDGEVGLEINISIKN